MISSFLRTATLALVVLLAAGCEEDVAAPTGVEEPFSMYGILNPRLPTQTLLVSPTDHLLRPFGDSINADVISTNLTSGERYVWHDSVSTNETGQLDHIFWADFRPDFSTRHRIEVTRSDGTASSVEVDVPTEVTVEEEDTGTRNLIVDVRGDEFVLIRVDAVFVIRGYRTIFPNPCNYAKKRYAFPYTGTEAKTEDGWRVEINLQRHYDIMRSSYLRETGETWPKIEFPFQAGLALMSMQLSITVGNEAWNPPGDTFDPSVLVYPRTLSNVENGFGFVGGGYNQDFPLYPSAMALADTWYFDFLDRRGGVCPNTQ